jgi:hypothetical protein
VVAVRFFVQNIVAFFPTNSSANAAASSRIRAWKTRVNDAFHFPSPLVSTLRIPTIQLHLIDAAFVDRL